MMQVTKIQNLREQVSGTFHLSALSFVCEALLPLPPHSLAPETGELCKGLTGSGTFDSLVS